MNRTSQGLLFLAIGVVLALVFGQLAGSGITDVEESYQVALRWTGRLAFFIFIIPFIASPLHTLVKSAFTQRLLRWRRNSGIAYGGVQSVHVWYIAASMQASEGNPFDVPTLVVGGFGLALAIAMMLTSFDAPAKLLGRKSWKRMHRTGFIVLAFVYFVDFIVVPIQLGFPAVYWPFFLITAAAFLLRIVARLHKPSHDSQSVRSVAQ